MNDKCAAGTGRFLASAAEALGMGLGDIGDISLKARNPVRLTTVCTVFVESDIMSYLAQGKKTEDILGGVHSAIAARTISLVRRVGIEPEVTFTGGVSLNIGMVRALEEKLGMKLNVRSGFPFRRCPWGEHLRPGARRQGERREATGNRNRGGAYCLMPRAYCLI